MRIGLFDEVVIKLGGLIFEPLCLCRKCLVASKSFKVIGVRGTPVQLTYDFLLVINSILTVTLFRAISQIRCSKCCKSRAD